MGKLAELAGTNKLRGAVCVTDAKGATHLYDGENAAEAAWGSKAGGLSHRRGAFFEASGADDLLVIIPDAPKVLKKKKRRSSSYE